MKDTLIQSPIQRYLEDLHEEFSSNRDGAVADYIPELATADPDWFGIAMVTVDGHVYQVGETRQPFTIQSASKPLTYGLALEDNGVARVLQKIGVEPSGDAFNSISLDPSSGRPRNPMINAGAIATTGLVHGGERRHRLQRILDKFALFFGHPVHVNDKVFASESSTGHRNRAISHMLRNFDVLEEDPTDTLELYFQQCSIEVTCRDLALAAATLANGGVNPITGVIALRRDYVQNVLSVMTTCGMYDYAGSWIYEIGIPAKSGVGGGILAVLPGQLGIGVFSPRLDPHGNSVRGIEVCRRLSNDFSLHIFNPPRVTPSVIRSSYNLISVRSKRIRPAAQNTILDRTGQSVRVLDLHGDLMFGTTEIAVSEVMKEANTSDFFLLDMKRVFSIDTASMRLIAHLGRTLAERKKLLFFINAADNFAFTKFVKHELRGIQDPNHLYLADKDTALEWCETKLIHDAGGSSTMRKVALNRHSMLRGFEARETKELQTVLKSAHYAAGELIFAAGTPADRMYFVCSGAVNIDLPMRRNLMRVAKLTPGMSFGEMALLETTKRSAQAQAETNVTCYTLSREHFENVLSQTVRFKLLLNISKRLAENLRNTNSEINALG